jgi:hypothetical protein
MNIAYLTALSALAGSIVGGLTSGITTWLSLRSAERAGRRAAHLARRQELFRDFIVAASNAYSHALLSDKPQIQEIVALYAMIGQMRISSSLKIVACADKIMRQTLDTYSQPNKTILQLHDLMKDEAIVDPLKEFSELAREELEAL